MLTVNSVEFYERVEQVNGQPVFAGKYEQLHFANYPATTRIPAIAIYIHADGAFKGSYFIRVRLGERIIFKSTPTSIHGPDTGDGENIGLVNAIESITFHSTGVYMFDIVFEDVVIYSAPLTLTWKTNKLKRTASRK